MCYFDNLQVYIQSGENENYLIYPAYVLLLQAPFSALRSVKNGSWSLNRVTLQMVALPKYFVC